MPISYTIDADLGIIRELWERDVSAADLRDYWERLLADPRALEIRRTVVDLRRANLTFSGDELWFLVDAVVVPRLQGRDWTTAIVIQEPTQMGVSRQYQVFAEHYSRDSIFEDYDEAVRWLTARH